MIGPPGLGLFKDNEPNDAFDWRRNQNDAKQSSFLLKNSKGKKNTAYCVVFFPEREFSCSGDDRAISERGGVGFRTQGSSYLKEI
ncbi:hypothetical protein Nepgr_028620 [Nepenthes gracilis]|uniref:Uncharacterized protein n=1 Tax=Nepenthes gracilis TaxID=150966 RepID=A0AAD3TE55_NEPGR|nr:hypothetical protein Nepgr_028620 [Nepenthes gracilis]